MKLNEGEVSKERKKMGCGKVGRQEKKEGKVEGR